MKKTKLAVACLVALISATACSNANTDQVSANAARVDSTGAPVQTINIRYIDEDSVSAHYNLAKDFKEASIRAFSRLEAAQQAKAKEIQSFGAQVEQKMRSNGYLSEASYNADVQKLNGMQESAQNYLANLQRTTESELAQQQQQLNDSLRAFLEDYNKTKGFDAILFKSAGAYFSKDLDITDEVIKGLNERYNKVQKK